MEQKNTLMGVLSYLGPLVIIPLLTAKEDPFVRFHVKQGLVLLIIEIIIWFVSMYFWPFYMLWQLANFAVLVLAILGIINVAQGKEKNLPLVGHYAHKIKI
ncbi:hypothetical protein H7X87_03375 [Acetobacteraceae bacterium]|nr:hypothetical protein [Candidatus Parcubacteria bacterium]